MSDPEQRIYDLLEVAEQHQKNITDAAAALDTAVKAHVATRNELKELETKVSAAATAGASAGAAQVTWQRFMMLAARSVGLVLAVWVAAWGAVGWQRHELAQIAEQKSALQGDIATMQATLKDLADQGGKIQLGLCTSSKRTCVKLDAAGKIYKLRGQPYLILDGY